MPPPFTAFHAIVDPCWNLPCNACSFVLHYLCYCYLRCRDGAIQLRKTGFEAACLAQGACSNSCLSLRARCRGIDELGGGWSVRERRRKNQDDQSGKWYRTALCWSREGIKIRPPTFVITYVHNFIWGLPNSERSGEIMCYIVTSWSSSAEKKGRVWCHKPCFQNFNMVGRGVSLP